MNTIQEIKQAITRLSGGDRESIADWLCEIVEEGHRVAEPPAAYGTAVKHKLQSVDEYLEFEENSAIRHEYVAGEIFSMSGASEPHEVIALNLAAAFHGHLRGGPCRAFGAGLKVRLKVNQDEIFYYPDVMVACGPNPEIRYRDNPRLIVEVLSPSTESIDKREKAVNYRHIPTLEEYVLVAERAPQVTIKRRSEEWGSLILSSLEETAEFRSIDLTLPLKRIYEGLP
jgi:Uma2 family endonuclease